VTDRIDFQTTDTRAARARSVAVPWLLAASGWLALAATLLPAVGLLRVLVTFGFLLVCPGLALIRLLERPDGLEEFVVGVALSVSLAVTVSVAMAAGHWWHPKLGLTLLAVLTTVAGVAGAYQLRAAGAARPVVESDGTGEIGSGAGSDAIDGHREADGG
jgi:hypothetical protein